MKDFKGYATLAWGTLLGLAIGAAVDLLGPGADWAARECLPGDASLYCFFVTWQELTAGLVAVAAAAVAALVAWSAAMKQVNVSANIPIVMRQLDMLNQQIQLDHILARLDFYEEPAATFEKLFERLEILEFSKLEDAFRLLRPIKFTAPGYLGDMAATSSSPGLRSELQQAERVVTDFESAVTELQDAVENGPSEDNEETLNRAANNTNRAALAVLHQMQIIKSSVALEATFIEKQRDFLFRQWRGG